jgi:hypothetical protein
MAAPPKHILMCDWIGIKMWQRIPSTPCWAVLGLFLSGVTLLQIGNDAEKWKRGGLEGNFVCVVKTSVALHDAHPKLPFAYGV